MLRRYRLAAGLTQEALAERAGLGVRSIQALERGANQPQRDTAERLATALDLDAAARARFLAAATPVPRHRSDAVPDATVLTLVPPPPAPRSNLPVQLTSFVGRTAEIATLIGLLAHARLLTLTGSGGVGKTRLALAVAGELADQYPGGVWLVELAALAEPALVPAEIAQTLGVREELGRPLIATLTDYLREKRLLLVLDNCEHLMAACAALAGALLRACPQLHILATSREALEVAGEQHYRVPSLPVPDLAQLPPPERLPELAAVTLFLDRARERRPDFALTPQNARAVAQVCARLDGIPLAIELAAARVGSLAVEGIAARLDDRFRLLTGGARDALPRQRTLRATLDWSYDLLSETEQLLLDRLSVFAGGCTLAAAAAVCSGEGVEDWEILDLLDRLVNKSLVQPDEAEGEVRYRLLESVRQYGLERLAAAGTATAVRDRHLAWYLALAEEAEPQLTGPEQVAWLRHLETEHDNLRAALRLAMERGRASPALHVAGALWRFWSARGHLSEGRHWLELALAVPRDSQDPEEAGARCLALHGATMLAMEQADLPHATALAAQTVAQARAAADPRHLARAFDAQGQLARLQGDHAQAITFHEEAMAMARQTTDRLLTAEILLGLGEDYGVAGEFERAEPLLAESLVLFRAVGDKRRVAHMFHSQAMIANMRGAHAQAESMATESVALFRELGDTGNLAEALWVLGLATTWQGAHARARAYLEESLALRQERGDRRGVGWSLSLLALVALLEGDNDRVLTVGKESLALLHESGDRAHQANVLAGVGLAALRKGQREHGRDLLAESLTLYRDTGILMLLPWAIEGTARVMAAREEMESAVRLYSVMAAVAQAMGFGWAPLDRDIYEETMAKARQRLGDDAFATEHVAGQAVTVDEAITLALEAVAAG
jgi:non-specific serine/threonine protein kinase